MPVLAGTDDDWKISWTPYLWGANIKADVTVNNLVSGSGELEFDDLVEKLDSAFMHYLHASKGEWGIANEIIYFDISESVESGSGVIVGSADVGLTQSIFDLAASYAPNHIDNTTFFFGLRRIGIDIDLDIESALNGPLAGSHSVEEDWTNLLIGVLYQIPLDKGWLLGVKADYGGDFGDEESYVLTLGADYSMTDLLSLKFGYRYAKIEFDSSDFKLDQTTDGGISGIGF